MYKFTIYIQDFCFPKCPATYNILSTFLSISECAKGVPLVFCASNPCDSKRCSAYPNAECKANYCGGCNAEFFVDDKKVDCSASLNPSKDSLFLFFFLLNLVSEMIT